MTPFTAELIGTMLLILMGCGVGANVSLARTKGHGAGWISVTTAWALAVFVGVVIAGPYSGAHLNPAVTLGFAVTGKFPWASVPGYVAAQFIGAALGALLVWVCYRTHFNATEDKAAILGVFCTGDEIRSNTNSFLCEMTATFALLLIIFHITDGEFVTGGTTVAVGLGSVGALPVAFAIWVIGLSLGGPTGYAINPARDIAPRFIHYLLPIRHKGSSNWPYAWIPGTAPLCGAVIAALLYLWIG